MSPIQKNFRPGKNLLATIKEHKDVVSSLCMLNFSEAQPPRFFLSGSFDGYCFEQYIYFKI